jgi:hypothetical protein
VGDPGCTSADDCIVTFSAVPAGKRLVITYASVRFSDNGIRIAYVFFPGGFFPLPAPVAVGSGNLITAGPVTAYFEPGQTPVIRIDTLPAGTSVNAFLSGYFVSLP